MGSQINKKDLNSNVGSTKPMAFHIDLNETPTISPREGRDTVSVCSVCRKGVSAGKRAVTEEQQREWKCFRCLLKNDGCSSSGGGGGAGFDINASPPQEAEGDHPADRMVGRIQAFPQSSFFNSMTSSIARNSANCGFEDMLPQTLHYNANLHTVCDGSTVDGNLQASNSTPLKYLPQSPNMLYLQTLREYIAERKGVLGEGWIVEFEFCDKRFKTSAVYIAPDGSRFESMEDVACHLGFPSIYRDATKKESSAFLTPQDFKLRPSALMGCNSHGFFSGSGISGCSEHSIKGLGFSENGSHDVFSIQFQDFCLISTGKIDTRPSYHNTNQIWPVGYRCSWHDKITGSLFMCEVTDGGDCGPIFKVRRLPCTTQSIPVGSSILSRTNLGTCKGNDNVGLNDSATFHMVDDDSTSIVTLLNEHSSPCLDNCVSTSKREDEVYHSQEDNSSNSNLDCLPLRAGNSLGDLGLSDIIGEFQVEGRSTSSVWEMISEAFLYASREAYKQNGAIKFFCGHDIYGMNNENLDSSDSLLRYSYWGGPFNIPRLFRNEKEFEVSCESLLTWLKQDRFGFDVDFVQEIIEQQPGATACTEYKNLNDRKHSLSLQSVGSGFLQVEQKGNGAVRTSLRNRWQSGDTEKFLMRDPCPPGKPLSARLPSYLIGDALQAWELAWRFLEVLGLGQSFSFQDLESELLSPWLDSCPLNSECETVDIGDDAPFRKTEEVPQARAASLGKFSGLLLAEIHGLLLKLLVSELLSKVAVYACPNFDAGESKSRRGKKKDLDCSTSLKKTKLDALPVNKLTWHEIARRYILSVLSMEGNLDSTEIASRESGKVFHCLRGDGGMLCGSLSGIAGLEGDAVILADAMKEIFGPLDSKDEIVSEFERDTDVDGSQSIEAKDGVIPEWAQVLEPVRKLPTNVGARIRRCVHEALEKNPPEWAKKMLEHSISKEVYKGNASGPTKRAVISVLANVSCEIPPQQKAEKKEKVKSKISMSDLIIKQCRIVLRRAATTDEDRVFCNLLGRANSLNPNDNDDEGLLGYPAMVSRPLDFRTIDLRLAAGAYGGSHDAFIDDVREVWRNIRIAYGDRSDLIELAENLSQKFEDLYKEEVLTLVDKIAKFSNVSGSSVDTMKERDELIVDVMKISLPRAPWDEGICKVCGMDKDDDNVLLCDRCDSEYHRYCLNPPLLKIPKGNWYCPSCVAGQSRSATYGSVAKQHRKNRDQGEFTRKFLEALARLANLMGIKEYWEFTVDERIFFTKFLFDEALNSATVRDHMDQCASRTADLQNKLRSISSELKIQKFKEEMLVLSAEKANSGVCNGRGDLKSDASSSLLNVENSSRGKPSDALNQSQYQQLVRDHGEHDIFANAQISRGTSWPNELPITIQYQKLDRRNTGVRKDLQGSIPSATQLIPGHTLSGSTGDRVTEHLPPVPVSSIHESRDMSSQDNSLKLDTIRNTISDLQDSIASLESELLKVSLRKDYLGRDSNGRVYWVFYWPGACPWIIANGRLASKKCCPEEFINIPDSDKWMSYQSDSEIEGLVGWLKETIAREKELKESILQLHSNKQKDSEYTEKHILSKGDSNQLVSSVKKKGLSADFMTTKAMAALEKKFGPCLVTEALDVHQNLTSRVCQDDRLHRCECLELLWPSRDHCPSCHWTFPTSEELRQHSLENCKAAASVNKKSQTTEDLSKCKNSRNVASQEKHPGIAGIRPIPTNEKKNGGSSFGKHPQEPDCPFKFEEIMARFVSPNSVKDSVMEIGLIGSSGVPSFLPNRCRNLSDSALVLGSTRNTETNFTEMPADLRSQQQLSCDEASAVDCMKECQESYGGFIEEGSRVERLKSILKSESVQVSPLKDTSSVLRISKSSIIHESSLRPLAGGASEILRFLKINLLDMDAALPEDALRTSRSNQERRCSWRAFVKSARTIYEMVQAIIILEDTIKSEYLHNDWWYWSSPSTAAKITTLSALALRIYALDSVISYEKPLPNGTTEILGTKAALDEDAPPDTTVTNVGNPSSPPLQKTPESEPTEFPRTRSRTSKRRKDLSG